MYLQHYSYKGESLLSNKWFKENIINSLQKKEKKKKGEQVEEKKQSIGNPNLVKKLDEKLDGSS